MTPRIVNPCINLRRDFAVRWLRIAISFTVTLLTLLCMLPAQAAQGSGWSVLLDEQGDLQLSDIRSARYTNQFSPIELDHLTAAEHAGQVSRLAAQQRDRIAQHLRSQHAQHQPIAQDADRGEQEREQRGGGLQQAVNFA